MLGWLTQRLAQDYTALIAKEELPGLLKTQPLTVLSMVYLPPVGGRPLGGRHPVAVGLGASQSLRLPTGTQHARWGGGNPSSPRALPPPALRGGGDEHQLHQVFRSHPLGRHVDPSVGLSMDPKTRRALPTPFRTIGAPVHFGHRSPIPFWCPLPLSIAGAPPHFGQRACVPFRTLGLCPILDAAAPPRFGRLGLVPLRIPGPHPISDTTALLHFGRRGPAQFWTPGPHPIPDTGCVQGPEGQLWDPALGPDFPVACMFRPPGLWVGHPARLWHGIVQDLGAP